MRRRVAAWVMALLVAALALPAGAELAWTPTDVAAQIMQEIEEGAFDALYGRFDAVMKAAVSEDALRQGWDSLVAMLGPMIQVEAMEAFTQQGMESVQVLAAHERGQSVTTITFDQEGLVAGLAIQPSMTGEEVEPLPVPEGAVEEPIVLRPGEEDETSGMLMLPAGEGPFPVAILLHGSGASDLDETVMGIKVFRDLAVGLCEQGIATLRYDKYPYAHPERMEADMTIDREYGRDVRAALSLLEAEDRAGDIYLIGHSEGGMLIPRYLQEADGAARGGVIIAGTPRSLWEVQAMQNRGVMVNMDEATYAEADAQVVAEEEKGARLMEMDDAELAETTIFGVPAAYHRDLMTPDPLQTLKALELPVLILQGGHDFQVSPQVDYRLWEDGLAGADFVTFKLYPDLTHLLTSLDAALYTGTVEDYTHGGHASEEVSADIAAWIHSQE